MHKWGGKLIGEIFPSDKVGVCQGHSYSEHPKRAPRQVSRFFLAYTRADIKSDIFMELPIGFVVEGGHPR